MKTRFFWPLVISLFVALVALGAAASGHASAQSAPTATTPCPVPEAPTGAEVCVDRGEDARYTEGDPIRICVTVGIAMIEIYPPPPAPLVRVSNTVDGGTPHVLFEEQLWSGERCLTATITPPLGQEVIRAEVIGDDGRLIASDSVSYRSVSHSSQPSALSVSVDRGPGGVYTLGDPIRICYSVPGPGRITLVDLLADGSRQTLLAGVDDGAGDCLDATVTPPAGDECLRLSYATSTLDTSTQICFRVVSSPSPQPCPQVYPPPPGYPGCDRSGQLPAPPSSPPICIQIYPPPPGCGDPNTPVTSHGGPVRDLVSLIDALRAAGAIVITAEPIDGPEAAWGERTPPLLSGRGWQVTVNGGGVQAYEYADEAAAAADAARISPDGDHFGTPPTVSVNWAAPPHFYRAERLIVLYVGSDPAVLRALDAVLGPQFAGR